MGLRNLGKNHKKYINPKSLENITLYLDEYLRYKLTKRLYIALEAYSK